MDVYYVLSLLLFGRDGDGDDDDTQKFIITNSKTSSSFDLWKTNKYMHNKTL